MLPLLTLSWLLVQAPTAQPNRSVPPPYRDDTVASAALGRTMKYRVLLPEGYEQSGAVPRAVPAARFGRRLHGLEHADGPRDDRSIRAAGDRHAGGRERMVHERRGQGAALRGLHRGRPSEGRREQVPGHPIPVRPRDRGTVDGWLRCAEDRAEAPGDVCRRRRLQLRARRHGSEVRRWADGVQGAALQDLRTGRKRNTDGERHLPGRGEGGAGSRARALSRLRNRGRLAGQQPGARSGAEEARPRLRVPRGPGRPYVGLLESSRPGVPAVADEGVPGCRRALSRLELVITGLLRLLVTYNLSQRAQTGGGLMDELRLAIRRLTKRPGATVVSIVTLACAIGAAAATWSLLAAILLRPLPVKDADRLVVVGTVDAAGRFAGTVRDGFIYPLFPVFRGRTVRSVDAGWRRGADAHARVNRQPSSRAAGGTGGPR